MLPGQSPAQDGYAAEAGRGLQKVRQEEEALLLQTQASQSQEKAEIPCLW